MKKDAEQLLRVRKREEEVREQGCSCLEYAERRGVDGTRMQSSCLEFEERRRVERTRMQSICLELKERRGLREEGFRAVAYE